jgi:flagellar biosynthesis/type III secretory pathway M-ring protein FliF/YscJ
MDNFWLNALWSLTPTVLLGLLFWLIIRSIVRSDRTEREARVRIEAEERAKRGLSAATPQGSSV